jgi:hypothetical protein
VAVAEVVPERCFVCGTPTKHQMVPSRPVITVFKEDGSQRENYLLPPVPAFGDCMQDVVRDRLAFGWCDGCRAWRVSGQASACGVRYSYL